jgi:hypothetical protein
MLVGRTIQVVYETSAHASRTRKGAAINRRRRHRLRLTTRRPGCSPWAASWTSDADGGGEPAVSGGTLTPEPEPDRRRPFIPSLPRFDRACHAEGINADRRAPWPLPVPVYQAPWASVSSRASCLGQLPSARARFVCPPAGASQPRPQRSTAGPGPTRTTHRVFASR